MRVVIVDDELLVADYLDGLLKKFNHEVVGITTSLSEAAENIRSARPDLVLLDIALSGNQNGIDLGRSLSDQGIPFIYISANNDPVTLRKAMATDPVCYLPKPFLEKDLVAALSLLP